MSRLPVSMSVLVSRCRCRGPCQAWHPVSHALTRHAYVFAGKSGSGTKEAVQVKLRTERAGLGAGGEVDIDHMVTAADSNGAANRKRAQARLASLEGGPNGGGEAGDGDEGWRPAFGT